MALADIITAIEQSLREKLDGMRNEHQKRILELKRESEKRTEEYERSISKQKEQKLKQLQAKAKTLGLQKKQHAVMQKKQELIDEAYAKLLKELENAPTEDITRFLKTAIESIGNAQGVILPAQQHKDEIAKLIKEKAYLSIGDTIDASGGFIFETENTEQDFSFASLIESTLKPQTELSLALSLFS